MHEIAKDIEKTIEFDGETLDDKMLYDKEIKPLRNEILTLNESLVQAVCGILNLHGNRKWNKIVSWIMNDASKVEISNKQNIVESELVSYITNNWEEKVSSPRSKTKKTEKFSYNEMKFKDIKHLIPETLVFSNTPTKVVVLNNKIYFLIGTAFWDRGIPSHYVDICGTEMKFLDHNWEWSSCPFIDVLIKCPNV